MKRISFHFHLGPIFAVHDAVVKKIFAQIWSSFGVLGWGLVIWKLAGPAVLAQQGIPEAQNRQSTTIVESLLHTVKI